MKKSTKLANDFEKIEYDEEFDKEVEKFLESYIVPKVEEEKIEETVDVLRQYMPSRKKKFTLITMIKRQISHINKFYFLISLSLIFIALFLPSKNDLYYYKYLICSSPISILIGLFEIVKSREQKMWELEKSLKYDYKEIILSRLIIISSFSIIINLILCGIFANSASANILLRLMVTWIAPFSIVASISLLIVSKISSNNSVILCICSWIAAIFWAQNFLLNLIESVGILVLITAIVISILVFVGCACVFYKRETNQEEGLLWN